MRNSEEGGGRGLSGRGLSLRYPGGVPAFERLDIDCGPGECVALEGGNGAGKSTLLAVLSGVIPQFVEARLEGEALFDGRPAAEHRCACLRQNPDDQILCDSVREELDFFRCHASRPQGGAWPRAEELARGMGIEDLMDRPVHRLSSGERQRFALAAGLAFSEGRLLLLDEPTAFLDAPGRRLLAGVLAERKAAGACVLLAGHEFEGLEGLVDRRVRLGAQASQAPSAPPAPAVPLGPVLLAADGLEALGLGGRPAFSGLSFELRAGETRGLCGPNGSGKSTLARVLAGMAPLSHGSVRLGGRRAEARSLWRAVALAGQNPFHGLLHPTLRECLESAWNCRASRPAVSLDEGAGLLGLEVLMQRDPQTLSFGEAQKAAILCAVLAGPSLLIVDEPLLDLDPASLAGLRALCAAVNREGGAVLLISHVPGVLRSFCPGSPLCWEEARCATPLDA